MQLRWCLQPRRSAVHAQDVSSVSPSSPDSTDRGGSRVNCPPMTTNSVPPSRPHAGPDAVLFDMDGTLLDSEKIWDIGLDALAAHLGGRLTPAARESMLGSPIGLSVRLVHEDLGVDADPVQSTAYLLDAVAAIFADDLQWRPGARELLTAVRAAGLPTGLVTSTVRRLT